MVNEREPYQSMLAENLGLPGFAKLPLHFDLQIFEGLVFEKTGAGKLASMTFVYKICHKLLVDSPIYCDIIEIIIEEISLLTRNDHAGLQTFIEASGFGICTIEPGLIFKHFLIELKDVEGLIKLLNVCPTLRNSMAYSKGSEPLRLDGFSAQTVELLCRHIHAHPEDMNLILFSQGELYAKILIFACSGALLSNINSLVQSGSISVDFTSVLGSLMVLKFNLSSSHIPNYETNFPRILEILHYVAHLFGETQYNCLELFERIFFRNAAIDVAEIKNPNKYDQYIISSFLIAYLIHTKRHQEALDNLETFYPVIFGGKVTFNDEFRSILCKEKPEFIEIWTRL